MCEGESGEEVTESVRMRRDWYRNVQRDIYPVKEQDGWTGKCVLSGAINHTLVPTRKFESEDFLIESVREESRLYIDNEMRKKIYGFLCQCVDKGKSCHTKVAVGFTKPGENSKLPEGELECPVWVARQFRTS